jgi:CIC family chloride channel protein
MSVIGDRLKLRPGVVGAPLHMPLPARARGLFAQIRTLIRGSEVLLVLIAVLVGIMAGGLVTLMSQISQLAHMLLYGIPVDERLSATARVTLPIAFIAPVGGGLLLGATEIWRRWSKAQYPVDPVEANALRGGRMSLRDSLVVSVQTLISNGCGASVGLEAGYTQIGAGLASRLGIWLNLRRSDLRILVGCGAAGAIAAAFGAPLTGAFYAFELIIGVYSISNVAPILAASLSAYLTSQALAGAPYALHAAPVAPLHPSHYLAILVLGLAASALGVAAGGRPWGDETGLDPRSAPGHARGAHLHQASGLHALAGRRIPRGTVLLLAIRRLPVGQALRRGRHASLSRLRP